jgi:hypothetical protein
VLSAGIHTGKREQTNQMGNRIDMVVDAKALAYEYHNGIGLVMRL